MKMISDFLNRLETSGINYVHWKSNTNIKLALLGVDDLDILVDPLDKEKLEDVFSDLKFIRAYSTKDKWQDGITHFIGLDIPSKKLVHVHLHYKLSLGYDYDKCFKLPIVSEYLENRVNYNNSVFLPTYENEYCILIIRLILKNALTPFLLMLPHRQLSLIKNAKVNGVVQGGGYKEFLDLKSKVDSKKLEKCLDENFPLIFTLTAPNEVLYDRVRNRKKSDGRGQYMNFEEFVDFCEDYDKTFEVIRQNVGYSKKINTEKKSLKKTYKTFKKKAYVC